MLKILQAMYSKQSYLPRNPIGLRFELLSLWEPSHQNDLIVVKSVKMSIIDHYIDYIRFFLRFLYFKIEYYQTTSDLSWKRDRRHEAVRNIELSGDSKLPGTVFHTVLTLKLFQVLAGIH